MRIRELPDHLAHDVRKVIAARSIGHKLGILVANFFPVHPVHRRLKKVIALLPPDFAEDLLPFLRRINFRPHPVQLERPIPHLFRIITRLGINDAVGVCLLALPRALAFAISRLVQQFHSIE